MSTIVLISCASKKLPHQAIARDLYISPLFRLQWQYAQQFAPSQVFILSAKYGVIPAEEVIEPYEKTLNKMSTNERKNWATTVLKQLQQYCYIKQDHFVILAGDKYRQFLLPHLSSYEIPLLGMTIGKQLHYLKEHINE